ncbi:exodeoxyribonuclease V subunit gamma [Paludibacterium yongneupense]|uniref:exodeoxyribonuclease V subunit gamma n=1 Tax=Paludibacterium yongneupense TaxID=400061 RepID=UPI0003F743F1|nr:exodeoxyribonuclease V subunit gamma [Paludibacterium yongneupense]
MLHLYQSNRLERLGDLFGAMVAAVPLADPFARETVIVQSRGMGRWLSLNLARSAGVAANLEFVLPAAFAWRLMQGVMPGLPAKSGFSPDVLLWRLMEILPRLDAPCFAPLAHYLAGGELARFELAGKVADIYDQYLVFRPDWIRAWESGARLGLGDDESWQAELWRELAAGDPAMHRVRMLDSVLPALDGAVLPERVSLFGIASLAPMYLAMVQRLSQLTDVCVFLLNPCAEYWGDVADAKGQLTLFRQGLDVRADHPLLASLGKQGRDFFDQIAEQIPDAREMFEAPPGDTLLARLQRDMLAQRAPAHGAQPLADGDRSIEIHVTHGAMRELEVLKDGLLDRFAADPTLTPADVAVLTPDINLYAPYIDAVFGIRTDAITIPYSIADRRIERDEPLLSAFAGILELADSRFDADDVLALLDCPELLRRFELNVDDLALIRAWVQQAAIRWGRDRAHKRGLDLPDEASYTWRWGMDRLLLGTVLPEAMAGDASALFAGLLPDGAAQGGLANVLARFADVYDEIEAQAAAWAQPATPLEWSLRLLEAVDALFDAGEDGEAALAVLRQALDTLAQDCELAAFDQRLPLAVVRDWLARRLSNPAPGGFLQGGVTFCAMVPMRSIPFRLLCLIGMNDGAYPRDERPVSFDLVAAHPRRGDRSRRFDDRYLFLEAILSARDTLYLSYVGLSARTGEAMPPSSLVSELCDTLAAMSGATGPEARQQLEERLTVAHPLQPFAAAAYDGSDPRLASFEPSFAAALACPRAVLAPFAAPLPGSAPPILRFDALLRFWRNPCRAWLSERLAIRLETAPETLARDEPFELGRDDKSRLRATLIANWLERRPEGRAIERIAAAGLLPPGELGRAWLAGEEKTSRAFLAGLPEALREPRLAPQPFALSLGGTTLVGEWAALRSEGILRVLPRRAYAGDLIELWLTQLLLALAPPADAEPRAQLFAEDGRYAFETQADAEGVLQPWVDYWRQGQALPLPFFARTSLAWAVRYAAGEDRDAAFASARQEWAPSFDGKTPQKDDPAIGLAFRELEPLDDPLFETLARILLLPMAKALGAGDSA